jgi:hypothetical protein
MPAQVPVWLGSKDITETADSPQFGHDATRFRVTRFYEGPFDAIVSNQPVRGNAFVDFPSGVQIVDVDIQRKPGGIGRITVKAESQVNDSNPAAPTYEVEWVEADKPVEQHPIFADGVNFGTEAGAYSLTLGDRAAVQTWQDENDFSLKSQWMFKIPVNSDVTPPTGYSPTVGPTFPASPITINNVDYNVFVLGANAIVLAKKKFRGQHSYHLWAPVVRQTLETFSLPAVDPCGLIETPPDAAGAPTGYVWQRSAQRATKTGRWGKWQQQQEWQGADWIDTDLNPSA